MRLPRPGPASIQTLRGRGLVLPGLTNALWEVAVVTVGYECAGDRISRASRLRRCLALRGAAVLVQRRAHDAAANPQKDVAGGAAGEEDGVRRDHRAPLLPRAGAALKLSVGLASHALTVAPRAVVSGRRYEGCSLRWRTRSRKR